MNAVVLVLPLALFALMAIALIVAVRRTSRVVAASRERDAFRASVVDLARRIDESLAGVAERIDLVRRHQVEPDLIGPNVQAASDAVVRYADEVRALRPPAATFDVRDAMVGELERAGRALEMAAYGCEILASAAGRHRNQEAQTAIKRGYLNVLHARDAIGLCVSDLDRLIRRASAAGGLSARSRRRPAA